MENTVIPAKIRGYRSRVINDLIDVTREINPLASDSVALEQFTNGTMFHTRERKGIKLPFHFKVVANGTNTVLIYAGRANPIHGATVADLPMQTTIPAASTSSFYDKQYELTMSDTGWVCLELDDPRSPTTLTPVRKAAYPTSTLFTQHLPIAYVIMSGGVITSCEQIYYGGDWIRQWTEPDAEMPDTTAFSTEWDSLSCLGLYEFRSPSSYATMNDLDYVLVRTYGTPPNYLRYVLKAGFADWLQAELQITTSQITDWYTWWATKVDSGVAGKNQQSIGLELSGGAGTADILELWRFTEGTNEAGVELDAESKITFRDYDGSSVKTLGYATKAEFATWLQAQLSIAYSQLTGVTAKRYGDLDPDDMVVVKT